MAGFKLSLVADVRQWLAGTRDVETSLDRVADSLDDVADQSGDDAKKMERRFSDAFSEVKRDAKKTGKAVGDDMHDGTRRASEGMDELKDEAHSTAREAAASFSGSADDIMDAFQEVAANAFAGFGPAGAVAGMAAAAGIALVFSNLQKAKEDADKASEAALELADALDEVDGNPAALDWATILRDRLKEIVDQKEWYEVWQDKPITAFQKWADAAKTYGFNAQDAYRGMAGDTAAAARVNDALDRSIRRSNEAFHDAPEVTMESVYATKAATDAAQGLKDDLSKQTIGVYQAVDAYRQLKTAGDAVSDATRETQEATTSYQEAVVSDLTKAGESWEDYTDKGKVNLSKYNANIEAHAKAVADFEKNLVVASSTLSAEALNYIRSLGPDAAPLLKAFVDAPLGMKTRTAANWDALGRAATDGYSQALGLDGVVQRATAKAQAQANGSPIGFSAVFNGNDLARGVNEAVNRINASNPTVRVRSQFVPREV